MSVQAKKGQSLNASKKMKQDCLVFTEQWETLTSFGVANILCQPGFWLLSEHARSAFSAGTTEELSVGNKLNNKHLLKPIFIALTACPEANLHSLCTDFYERDLPALAG